MIPKKIGAVPHLAPNLTWAARPPAPWQEGMAPNQQPTKFMSPTDVETSPGFADLSGNSWVASWQTEITEFNVVRGNWGNPALRIPVLHSSEVGTMTLGVEGPRLRVSNTDGFEAIVRIMPRATIIRAEGILFFDGSV